MSITFSSLFFTLFLYDSALLFSFPFPPLISLSLSLPHTLLAHIGTHFKLSLSSLILLCRETQILRVEPQAPRLDLEQEWSAAPRGCLGRPGQCKLAAGRNWSEEFGTGSGESGRWHEQEQGFVVNAMWETEGLQTLGIVVIVCASLKLLHLLGLISFSEGKRD